MGAAMYRVGSWLSSALYSNVAAQQQNRWRLLQRYISHSVKALADSELPKARPGVRRPSARTGGPTSMRPRFSIRRTAPSVVHKSPAVEMEAGGTTSSADLQPSENAEPSSIIHRDAEEIHISVRRGKTCRLSQQIILM